MSIPEGDPRRDPNVRNHFVYRYFDDQGVLLYVGCSYRPEARWREHKADRKQWTALVASCRMQGPFNYDTARTRERQALLTEKPVYAQTPQDQSARVRRDAWIRRHMAPLLWDDMKASEQYAIYVQVAAEADKHDWLGESYDRMSPTKEVAR